MFDRLFDIPIRRSRSPSKGRSSSQETTLIQHSCYYRQMKILNASVLFTIGNISPELSEIFSKGTKRKQQSSLSRISRFSL